jgi:hypothetical protein
MVSAMVLGQCYDSIFPIVREKVLSRESMQLVFDQSNVIVDIVQ